MTVVTQTPSNKELVPGPRVAPDSAGSNGAQVQCLVKVTFKTPGRTSSPFQKAYKLNIFTIVLCLFSKTLENILILNSFLMKSIHT